MICVISQLQSALRVRRLPLVGFLAAFAATLAGPHTAFSEQQTDDRLLRMDPGRAIFSNPPYERLCKENLFVTPGEVARYFFVPVFKDPEMLVSLYRSTHRAGGLPGNYWLTLTRPLRRIVMPSNSKRLKVERHDAPIPESTARATHQVWLAMLQQARPRTRLDMEIDSDAMFFYTTDAAGKTLRGERFGTGDNVLALADIGGLLITYGYASLPERAALARTIEAKATALYKRIH
jgi:hypothetical protein